MLNRLQKANKEGLTGLSVMNNDLGIMYFAKKEYEKSLDNFMTSINYLDELLAQELLKNNDVNSSIVKTLQEQIMYVKDKIIQLLDILGKKAIADEDYLKAIDYYKVVLSYYPNREEVLFDLGACLDRVGAFSSALLFFKRAIDINPECAPAYKFVSEIYNHKLEDFANAIIYMEKYVKRVTTDAFAYNTLGHLYEAVTPYENFDKIIGNFEKALELQPDLKIALRNLAVVYPRVGRDEDAINCYKTLIKLGPMKRDLFNYSCELIRLKNFKEGWAYYESRFDMEEGATVYPKFNKPKWNGKPILNKVLLVQHEQGFGDSIQFLRYLDKLIPMTKKIILRVQDDLVDLFKFNVSDHIQVIGKSTPEGDIKFDYHVPIMSLLYLLNETIESIPFRDGYIKAVPEKIEDFKKKFFDNSDFKIGISWHGAANGRKNRNVPLSFFAPLAKLKNVKVYSLQKFAGTEELLELPQNIQIKDMGREFKDFSDTAAAISNLDLVVTSDNSVFNLAAAMGKQTILLLPHDAEWRWFYDDETTPWYSSVRIIKKKNENDSWAISMQRVIDLLVERNFKLDKASNKTVDEIGKS